MAQTSKFLSSRVVLTRCRLLWSCETTFAPPMARSSTVLTPRSSHTSRARSRSWEISSVMMLKRTGPPLWSSPSTWFLPFLPLAMILVPMVRVTGGCRNIHRRFIALCSSEARNEKAGSVDVGPSVGNGALVARSRRIAMTYGVPGHADQVGAELLEKWNDTVRAAYEVLRPSLGSRFFALDPGALTSPVTAPVKWFGD